jgi:hypothetical protein
LSSRWGPAPTPGSSSRASAALHIENCLFANLGNGVSMNAVGRISVVGTTFRNNNELGDPPPRAGETSA